MSCRYLLDALKSQGDVILAVILYNLPVQVLVSGSVPSYFLIIMSANFCSVSYNWVTKTKIPRVSNRSS